MASTIKVDTIQSTTSNVFFQNSAGTEYARFDSSGNLGIGTTSPGAKLDVRGSSTFLINSSNPTAWVSSDSGLTTQSMYMQVNTTSSDTRLGSYTSHPLVFLTNNAERMRIDSSGNVGIGTANPAAKLHVNTTSAALFIGYGANYDNYIQTNNLTLFTNYNGSTEYMRLNSSGNLLIGTTNSFARLTVSGSIAPIAAVSSFWGLDFASSAAGGTYITLANGATYDLAGGSGMVFIFEDSGVIGFGQLACVYGTTSVVWQSGTGYSNTSGTANKINFYYGPGTYRIQNSTGSSKSIWVSTLKMRNSS